MYLLRSFSTQDQESVPKQAQEYLSAPALDCLCKARASSWSFSINPNRTGNLSLLLPWSVSARQASLPRLLVSPFTGALEDTACSAGPTSSSSGGLWPLAGGFFCPLPKVYFLPKGFGQKNTLLCCLGLF